MIDSSTRQRIVDACSLGRERSEQDLRALMVETCRSMNSSGLNQGKSGNLSARLDPGVFLVTPSGMDYDSMRPDHIVRMTMQGAAHGSYAPSSEWRMHRDILLSRPDVCAVLHAHPIRSTALACHGRSIPAFHYMVAVAGGADIRCAAYATFGTQELADNALRALEGRRACLLEHHGMLALGDCPRSAFELATEVETLAAMYLEALTLGEPPRLSNEEMSRVSRAFAGYGQVRSL